jgi:hypothetical protein
MPFPRWLARLNVRLVPQVPVWSIGCVNRHVGQGDWPMT